MLYRTLGDILDEAGYSQTAALFPDGYVELKGGKPSETTGSGVQSPIFTGAT
jgi:hypothetical protein